MDTLQAGPIIRFGWETFKKRPWFFIGTFLVINVLSNLRFEARDLGIEDVSGGMAAGFFLVSIILIVVSTLFKMGGNAFLLKTHASPETVKFSDIWAPNPFWRFVGAMLLKGLVVAGPMAVAFIFGAIAFFNSETLFIVAIVLGIAAVLWAVYMGVRLMFSDLVVMEKGLMPIAALKESYQLTEGVFWRLVILMLASFGVIILGLLALVVGLLVAMPVVMLAYVHTYRLLASRLPA